MDTTDSVVKNTDLYVARDNLVASLKDGEKALALVNETISGTEKENETRSA